MPCVALVEDGKSCALPRALLPHCPTLHLFFLPLSLQCQKEVYKSILRRDLNAVVGDKSSDRTVLQNILMQLRKVGEGWSPLVCPRGSVAMPVSHHCGVGP